MSPRIGVTTYARTQEDNFRIPCNYVDAIRRAGGLPLLMPAGETRFDRLLEALDGLLLIGGGDVCPALYQGEQHKEIYETDDERDQFEIELVNASIARGLPLLGICRGIQVLNVALGGTLYEHLPDHFGEEVAHRLPPKVPTPHALRLAENSRLAGLLGQHEFTAASWHHQAIDTLGAGLTPVAWAPDGVIEAVEMESHPWLIAVQWHPELTAAEDPIQQRLFDQFVAATGKAA